MKKLPIFGPPWCNMQAKLQGLEPPLIIQAGEDLLIANKPAGVPVHGGRILADKPETLLGMVRSQTGSVVHAVHRLDRPVSGAVLLALSREALAALGKEFEYRRVRKSYLAIVRGWATKEGFISHPLRAPRDERREDSIAREALTRFQRLAKAELPFPVHPYATARYSLLALYPETGRRHQLRRHMKHISHHLLGDTTYGRGEHNRLFRLRYGCERLLLHAWSLEFQDPRDGQKWYCEAPLDRDFLAIINDMGWGPVLNDWQNRSRQSR